MKKILINCDRFHKGMTFEVIHETENEYLVSSRSGELSFLKQNASELIEPHEAMKLIKDGVEVDRFVVDTWRSTIQDSVIYFSGLYRVTPPRPNLVYTPFTSKDYKSFFMAPIKTKSDPQTVHAVVGYNDNGILVCRYGLIKYDEALENITFYDGRPFGKEVRGGN